MLFKYSSLIQAGNFSPNSPVPKRGFRDWMKLRERILAVLPQRRRLNIGCNTQNLNLKRHFTSKGALLLSNTLNSSTISLTLSINKR